MSRAIAIIWAAILVALPMGSHAEGGHQPPAEMLVAPEAVARFVDTQEMSAPLAGEFASKDVVIVDNTSPYVFTGPDAVVRWAEMVKTHMKGITNLQHVFGEAHEFSRHGDHAYFSLPVTWTELYFGKRVVEHGAWVFVMVKEDDAWRVQASVWGRVYSSPHK